MLQSILRAKSTKRNGTSFDQATINQVWMKATPILGRNPLEFRRDKCGATIKLSEYGNRNSVNGWEIDHIIPVSKGGGDELNNLQPLQWQNNASKSDGPDYGFCKVIF
jgi:hypothetical protein